MAALSLDFPQIRSLRRLQADDSHADADFFYVNNGLTALGVSPFPSTTVSSLYALQVTENSWCSDETHAWA